MASSPRSCPGLPVGGLPAGGRPLRFDGALAPVSAARSAPHPLAGREKPHAPRARPSAARTRFGLAAAAAACRLRDGSR